MLEFDPITIRTALSTAFVAVGLGALSFWANPKRIINQAFFGLSLHAALWLMCLEIALAGGPPGLFFVRLTTAIGSLVPANLWVLKECVVSDHSRWKIFRRSIPWVVIGIILAALCFTGWFVPAESTPTRRLYGPMYYVHMASMVGLYLTLVWSSVIQARKLSGVQRLELQVLLLGSCFTALVVIVLMCASALDRSSAYISFQPPVVLLNYGATAWAILNTKVFDARHLLAVCVHRMTLIMLITVSIWGLFSLGSKVLPEVIAFIFAVGLSVAGLSENGPWLRTLFGLTSAGGSTARNLLYEVSREDLKPEALAKAYGTVLSGWAQTDRVYVMANDKALFEHEGLVLDGSGREVRALERLGWVTPERLARQRVKEGFVELERFMLDQGLGAMVISPGRKLRVILATGLPPSRRPSTYPQVRQLIEFSSIIEGGMERAHFSARARRSEQLATVGMLGASLAHEIRNPLVTLKTFAQLFPLRHSDPVFREKFQGLLSGEVARIEHLTEQLLNMASPYKYQPQRVSLNKLAEECFELIAPKARTQNVQLRSDFGAKPDLVFTDPQAVRQVLLNLCINGLQAMESLTSDRWLQLATRHTMYGVELTVTDNGPGIPAEIRPRLFQAFATSKSSGFGLGLAICSDILAGLDATISAEPDSRTHGASFRIVFPEAKE